MSFRNPALDLGNYSNLHTILFFLVSYDILSENFLDFYIMYTTPGPHPVISMAKSNTIIAIRGLSYFLKLQFSKEQFSLFVYPDGILIFISMTKVGLTSLNNIE